MDLSTTIRERALDAGFDLAGIVSLDAVPRGFWHDLDFARRWVDGGHGGEMRYLANPKRDDPRRVLPSVKSVICVGMIYNAPLPYSTEVAESSRQSAVGSRQKVERSHGWVSRYAWGQDYHRVMRSKLERLRGHIESLAPGVETRVYVDTGPVLERALARYSGIGWVGKNTCLINQEKGSWLFLGVILTDLALTPDFPAPDRCGSCTRCLEACPTGALTGPYVMDASRCIAYFTIEIEGSIPLEFRSAIGLNVFGCDICQDVCPWNGNPGSAGVSPALLESINNESGRDTRAPGDSLSRPRQVGTTDRTEFQPLEVKFPEGRETESETAYVPSSEAASFSLFNPPLEALASLSEEDFRRAFSHSPIKRAKYRGWLRNLCVAMGNSGSTRFIPWLERACQHSDPVVREHAEWALGRLEGTGDSE